MVAENGGSAAAVQRRAVVALATPVAVVELITNRTTESADPRRERGQGPAQDPQPPRTGAQARCAGASKRRRCGAAALAAVSARSSASPVSGSVGRRHGQCSEAR